MNLDAQGNTGSEQANENPTSEGDGALNFGGEQNQPAEQGDADATTGAEGEGDGQPEGSDGEGLIDLEDEQQQPAEGEGEKPEGDGEEGEGAEGEEKSWEDMTDEEKADYVPKDADGYKLDLPEGYAVDDAVGKSVLAKFHEMGLNNSTVNELLKLDHEIQAAQNEAHIESLRNVQKAWVSELKDEWGDKAASKSRAAYKGAVWAGGNELVKALKDMGLSNHPMLAKAFAKIGEAASGESDNPNVFNNDGRQKTDVERGPDGSPMLNFD